MATETAHQPHDPTTSERSGPRRRGPFAWVKKFANFKSSSPSGDSTRSSIPATSATITPSRHLRRRTKPHASASKRHADNIGENDHCLVTTTPGISARSPHDGNSQSNSSVESLTSVSMVSADGQEALTMRSVAPTASTEHEASRSISAPSHVTSTTRTLGGGVDSRRGEDSTFSSPASSVRSLTTTLTTIRSLAPSTGLMTTPTTNTQSAHYQQPFPSAIPQHLTPGNFPGHPTYSWATANGVLTDNASILTLASSSKRRRRRSLDTNASVRALAPSSLWGGSRESLPLSVLSATIDVAGAPVTPGTPGHHGVPGGSSRIERTSIYSTTGGPGATIQGERNSLYAKPNITGAGDNASVHNGPGHGRADSVNGSVNGLGSPVAIPRDNVDIEHPLPRGDEQRDEQSSP